MHPIRILSIDDLDCHFHEELSSLSACYEILTATSFKEGTRLLRAKSIDVLLLDRYLEHEKVSGIELIPELKKHFPTLSIVIVTQSKDLYAITRAYSLGASDYIIKTETTVADLQVRIPEILKKTRMSQSFSTFSRGNYIRDCPLIGNSAFIFSLPSIIHSLNSKNCPILICGASGTGVNTLAKKLWNEKKDAYRPFVRVSLRALRKEHYEETLFGRIKHYGLGFHNSNGSVLDAHGGDLVIEDFHLLSLSLQQRLVKMIQSGKTFSAGATLPVPVEVRLILSAHLYLEKDLNENRIDPSLFRLLEPGLINIPPLKERKEDIPQICRHILESLQANTYTLTESAIQFLAYQNWPGNYPQLYSALATAVACISRTGQTHLDIVDILSSGELSSANTLNKQSDSIKVRIPKDRIEINADTYKECLSEVERTYLLKSTAVYQWDIKALAKALKVTPGHLYKKFARYNIRKPELKMSSTPSRQTRPKSIVLRGRTAGRSSSKHMPEARSSKCGVSEAGFTQTLR